LLTAGNRGYAGHCPRLQAHTVPQTPVRTGRRLPGTCRVLVCAGVAAENLAYPTPRIFLLGW